MFRCLSGPDRYDGIEDSRSPTINQASLEGSAISMAQIANLMRALTEDHPYVILGRGLKGSTKDGPCSTERDGLNTAITISERASNETANQGAEIVHGDLQRSDTPRPVEDHSLTIPPCSRVLSMIGPSGPMWPNFIVFS